MSSLVLTMDFFYYERKSRTYDYFVKSVLLLLLIGVNKPRVLKHQSFINYAYPS